MIERTKIEIANKLHYKLKSWAITDEIITYLFTKYSQNTELEIVDLKVRLLNSLYYAGVRATAKMAGHICNLNGLDDLIRQGDIQAVGRIAQFRVGDKTFNMLSFASKYCYFHGQDKFPVYDSYALRALKIITGDKLDNYTSYSKAIFNLTKEIPATIREIDRYLWLYGQKCTKDKNKLSWSIKSLFDNNKDLVEQL